ncbi:Signal transduction histidine-protein kinase BarA [BD1-7 clade bacterium]|uniref:histidine kinase n=1 Tax=BD1-7 clade bacterium TaxID=2029982 RepID=A0A5S9P0Y7_9GAMM|nr:Signal transduction histidine-protein kinase BarA [BD1-7 clade bacterium]CAA0122443.1 Signal transduction histidine-protein kinase BarA [BD1-7 clade bacterium]
MIKNQSVRFLAQLLLFSWSFFAVSANASEYLPEGTTIEAELLVSPVKSLQEVKDNYKDLRWLPLERQSGYINAPEGSTWVRVTISNRGINDHARMLELAFPAQSVDLYRVHPLTAAQTVPSTTGPIASASQQPTATENNTANLFARTHSGAELVLTEEHMDLGHQHRFSSRPINYRNILYPINLRAGETTTLLFRVDHYFDQLIKIIPWDSENLQKLKTQEHVFFGMIYGSLFMIIIYNLFIWFSIRERSHLLFVFFGTATGLFMSMHEGHFAQFVAPEALWPKDMFYAIIAALMCIGFTFFSSSFLDLNRWSPNLTRMLLGAGAVAATVIILIGLSDEPIVFSPYLLLIVISLYVCGIYAGLYIRNQGIASAGYFSLAIFLCTLGLMLDFGSNISVLPWTRWSFSYASIGNTAMILVFAFALADKMRQLNNEKLDTTYQLMKLTEEKAQSNIEVYKSKLNEVQLEKRADEAKIESRAKSEFLATMSHQIRTPMNGILGMTELLDDTVLEDDQRHFVSSINKSAKSLLNVINDLLDYSKIESGTMALESKLFNLERIIDDCINISALKATETKLNFVGCVEPNTHLQLKGDAPKIRQVTLNLLNIVFGFSSGGTVVLKASQTGKNTVNSTEVRVEVVSKGVLLTEEDVASLLQPFNDAAKSSKQKGQEIGLAVSRELIELMHGRLGIDRDEHVNSTTLWFTTRLLLPHTNEMQRLMDRSKILSGRRLLICDDNEEIVTTIKGLTESWGMQCNTCSSARDASELLLHDDSAYQVLMIAEEFLTPEVQLAIRKSNVDHNFITSVNLITRVRFTMTQAEMKKRGIQSVLEIPYSTLNLYQSLLKSMGIDNVEVDKTNDAPLSILVAEDNTVNQMVIDGLLKKLRFKPRLVNNGLEAVNTFLDESTEFNLIFMDCEMPEMSGYEACKAIREFEQKNNTELADRSVIIGLSAHSTPEYREQAYEAGMNDFIVKPLTIEDIEDVIERMRNNYFNVDLTELNDNIDVPHESRHRQFPDIL